MENLENLKYPVGKFKAPENISSDQLQDWILQIDRFPSELENEFSNLSEAQLEWIYRPEGWSIRQVVHHLTDSHLNSFMRFKLALTEENPVIKPYQEDLWAELPDSRETPIGWSIHMLTGLHRRWVYLLEHLEPEDFAKTFFHPEQQRKVRLDRNVGIYAWHGLHHLAHVRQAIHHQGKWNQH